VTAARAELLGRVGLVVASSLLALLLAEGALRAFPTVLGQEFANGVLSRYRDGPGGINYWDPALKMAFMRPSFETEMYYNGYRWRHQTDALGFRNDTVKIPADVVLLGDSLIYGHGVDFDQTVGHHLERLTGLRVMNLARQGDCAFHQAYLATAYVGVFRPRHVLYFFFDNDITDLYGHLSEEAMRAYLAWDPALGYPPRSEPPPPPRARWSSRRLYLARAWRFVTRRQAPPPARLPVAVAATNDEDSLGWRYTRKAILQMRDATERHGAAFVMIPLTFQSRHHHDILERFAREHGITLLDVRPVLEPDRSFFLPGDGHFTGRGARALAERVAAFLRQRARRQPEEGASARASRSRRSTWNFSASASPATRPSPSITRYSSTAPPPPPPMAPPRTIGTPQALGTAVHGPPAAWMGQTSVSARQAASVSWTARTAG
jgi:hypothetical protein